MQELWFLPSACHLMLIDIHMKFREDIFNCFQVIERTQFNDGQTSKGNNSKSIEARVMVLQTIDDARTQVQGLFLLRFRTLGPPALK